MSKKYRSEDKRNNIFYFNQYHNRNQKTYSNFFKGSKLSVRNQEKINHLKSKYSEKLDQWNLRYGAQSFENQNRYKEQVQLQNQSKSYERQRLSLQSFRPKALSQWVSYTRRSIRSNDPLMISSESSNIPKSNQKRQFPHFSSKNLQSKTNQYLNLILKRTQIEQDEKIQKILEEDKQKDMNRKTTNIFMRKMKINLNKSKSRDKSGDNMGKTQYLMPANDKIQTIRDLQKQHNILRQNKSKFSHNPQINLQGLQIKYKQTNKIQKKRKKSKAEQIPKPKNQHIIELKDKVKQWEVDQENINDLI